MAHEHLTLTLSWFQNNQEFDKERSQLSKKVKSKSGYFIDIRSGADLPSNDFNSTQSNIPAKNPLLLSEVF